MQKEAVKDFFSKHLEMTSGWLFVEESW